MPSDKKEPSTTYTFKFIIILSFSCALVLSLLASALKEPQERARELDRSRQMLQAAKLIDPQGHFLIERDGQRVPARYEEGQLIQGTAQDIASDDEILQVYKKRFRPFLVDRQGQPTSFEEAGINLSDYLLDHEKAGYAYLDYKLVYEILPNGDQTETVGYVLPVNGFGLWDAIYGYLAIEPDGNTIRGLTWYDQKETPGVGAVISDPSWQSNFDGKKIFATGMDLKRAPIGVRVVKGKVSEVVGSGPKAMNAVDGIPGATLTGNGVTKTLEEVLNQYRPFLIRLAEGHREAP